MNNEASKRIRKRKINQRGRVIARRGHIVESSASLDGIDPAGKAKDEEKDGDGDGQHGHGHDIQFQFHASIVPPDSVTFDFDREDEGHESDEGDKGDKGDVSVLVPDTLCSPALFDIDMFDGDGDIKADEIVTVGDLDDVIICDLYIYPHDGDYKDRGKGPHEMAKQSMKHAFDLLSLSGSPYHFLAAFVNRDGDSDTGTSICNVASIRTYYDALCAKDGRFWLLWRLLERVYSLELHQAVGIVKAIGKAGKADIDVETGMEEALLELRKMKPLPLPDVLAFVLDQRDSVELFLSIEAVKAIIKTLNEAYSDYEFYIVGAGNRNGNVPFLQAIEVVIVKSVAVAKSKSKYDGIEALIKAMRSSESLKDGILMKDIYRYFGVIDLTIKEPRYAFIDMHFLSNRDFLEYSRWYLSTGRLFREVNAAVLPSVPFLNLNFCGDGDVDVDHARQSASLKELKPPTSPATTETETQLHPHLHLGPQEQLQYRSLLSASSAGAGAGGVDVQSIVRGMKGVRYGMFGPDAGARMGILSQSKEGETRKHYMTDSVQNLTTYDPFADAEEEHKSTGDFVHIRIQQRNARKTLTTVQGLDAELDQKKILKVFKKGFCCNGTIVEDPEMGEIIQLQGDQRLKIAQFLIDQEICMKDQVKVHGF